MRKGRMAIGLVVILVLALGGTAYAGVTADDQDQRPDEVLLEGDVRDQVIAAAIAAAGDDATVVRAETDADGNAAYEVHMVRDGGSLVTVYVDESFSVVSVVDHPVKQVKDNRVDGKNDGCVMPWGEQRIDETLLEGDVLDAVVAAAMSEVGEGAKVLRAETDADGHAMYEVHMLTADGSLVTVYVEESYAVLSVAENAGPGPGWMGVLRGKLKIRDQNGEKLKYRDQIQERVQKYAGDDESEEEDQPEATFTDRDRDGGGKDADKGRSNSGQGRSQEGSKRGGSSRR